jgi:hypothetical protein
MTQERLLEGWDDIGISLRRESEIETYELTSTATKMSDVFDDRGHARRE